MIYSLIFILILAVLAVLGHYLLITEKQVQQNNAMKMYFSEMRNFSSAIEGEMDELRLYRHDLARYIRILEKLSKQTDDDTIRRYMDILQNETKLISRIQPAFCDHEGVNTVLSIILKQCETEEIDFLTDLEPLPYTGFENVNLLGLLYNLLEDMVFLCMNKKLGRSSGTSIFCHMHSAGDIHTIDMELGIHVADGIKKSGIRRLPQDETTAYMLRTVCEQYGMAYSMETGEQDISLRIRICDHDLTGQISDGEALDQMRDFR